LKNIKSFFFMLALVGVILLSFSIIISREENLNNKNIIKFAYIQRSEEGHSYNDIYNKMFILDFAKTTNSRIKIIEGSYEELHELEDIDVFIDFPGVKPDIKTLELPTKLKHVLYTNQDLAFEDIFFGKKIALFKRDDFFYNDFTMNHYNNYYSFIESVEEGFHLLENGEIDAFFSLDDPIYLRNPQRDKFKTLDVNRGFYPSKTISIFNEEIDGLLEKYVRSFDVKKKMDIEEAVDAKLIWSQVTLSEEEKEFLKNKKVIKVGGNFDRLAPLAYYENKQLKGSIYEYFKIFTKGTGVEVQFIKENNDDQLLRGLKNKTIDIDAAFTHTRDIDGFIETSPYFVSQMGIFSLVGKKLENLDNIIEELDESMGATGIRIDPFSKEHHFKANLKIDRLYDMLQKEEIDYFTHSYSLLRHPYNLEGIKKLRLYKVYDKKMTLSMGSLDENKIIVDIMNRLFQYLDHDDIRYKWEMTSSSLDRKTAYKKVVFLFGVALFFLLPYLFILKVEMVKIKKIEKELQETKMNLENALNVKSAFLANMSHEMRTPLTAVLGFNKLLIKKEEDPKKKELMKNVGLAANNLLEFINNVLDLSKLESGKIELKPKRINLYQMAKDLEKISLGLKRSEEVAFKFTVANDAPKYFMGDEVWLKEIILNLLGNAFKFTEKGSVQLILKKLDENLIIEVRDTGIGMKNLEEDGEKIFKRYEQLDLNENRDKKGSGLGLAIVKEVVELMEGTIHVKSIYQIGTTFTISLPIKKTLDIHDKGKLSKLQGSTNEQIG